MQRAWWYLGLAIMLAACGGREDPIQFRATDITGAEFARQFQLKDATGAERSLASFKGKVVVLFFGYTHCPDVCPTTMHDLNGVLRRLGPDAQQVQVLFATVDPERDSAAILAQYVPGFNPTFIALRPETEQLSALTREYKLVVQRNPGKTPGAYTVDHTAGSYVYDRDGRVRLFANYGHKPDDWVHDLKALLSERP